MKLVWTLFGVLVSCLEDAARVELRLLNPAPTALACCLAVPPSVAGQAPPGARELGRLGSTLTVSAYGFADVTEPGNERAPTGPPAGLRGHRGAAVTRPWLEIIGHGTDRLQASTIAATGTASLRYCLLSKVLRVSARFHLDVTSRSLHQTAAKGQDSRRPTITKRTFIRKGRQQ